MFVSTWDLNSKIVDNGVCSCFTYILHMLRLYTNPHWARVVGYGPFTLCEIHKEGLCYRGDINGLMMMIMTSI
jgi:hypothetical protein